MRLIIFTGFLGSGKTTLLLQAASHLASHSQNVTIIENEIGEIGIDGQYLDLQGLKVQELFGGCVCCTLSAGLIETIDKICDLGSPDWIILEATGIARPKDITGNLHRLKKGAADVQVVTVVDAGRYEMLMSVMEPLITGQIEPADFVVVNKADQLDSGAIEQVVKDIDNLNPGVPVLATSAQGGRNLDSFLKHIM